MFEFRADQQPLLDGLQRLKTMTRKVVQRSRTAGLTFSKIQIACDKALEVPKFQAVMCVPHEQQRHFAWKMIRKYMGAKYTKCVDRYEQLPGDLLRLHLTNGAFICVALVEELDKFFPRMVPKLPGLIKADLDERMPTE